MPETSIHAFLSIVKGVAKVPLDTLSAEAGLDSISLLDPNGFSCDEYVMRMPGLKSSAVYADSPLTDGRTLISGSLDNVKETIRLTLHSSTMLQLGAQLSKLARMKQDCNDFWDTFGQIEPVYLKHQIVGEPGPRYALLYDIEIDVEAPTNPNDTWRTLTINVEREFGWRGLAPGDNPKRWAFDNVFANQQLTASNASLISGIDFLFYETSLRNRVEHRSNQTGYNVKNFVDIPADSIPGDLPALICVNYGPASATIADANLLISKFTRKNTGNTKRTNGANQYIMHVFNAADALMGTDTALAADTGASRGITGLQRRSQTTFGTATLQTRLSWSGNQYTTPGLSLSVLRGRYAVFARARLSAGSTTVGLQLSVQESGGNIQSTTPVTFTNEGSPTGTGNTTYFGMAYLGQITLPSTDRKTIVRANGLGIGLSDDVIINLNASRTAGAGVLYVNDVILVPIDEGAVNLAASTQISSSGGGVIYDNTGYLRHGMTGDVAIVSNAQTEEADTMGVLGPPIYLTPGVDNRLEFLFYDDASKMSLAVEGTTGFFVRLSIVPRWIGYRDK